jgi:hypothetical protein
MKYTVLLLAIMVAGAFNNVSAGGAVKAPVRYSCVIDETKMRGRSEATLQETQRIRKVVLHDGSAYRIETYVPPDAAEAFTVVLNNGDRHHQQFVLIPARKSARLDLASVQWLFYKHHPEAWKQQYGQRVPPPPPSRNVLRTWSREEHELDMKLNPSTRLTVARDTEVIDGKRCRLHTISAQHLKDARTRRVDPDTRQVLRLWVWEGRGIVLRKDVTAVYQGTKPPRPMASRTITTVSELNLNPRIDRSRFELPPGTTAQVFSDYPAPLPKGVIPRVIPGSGLDLSGRTPTP